MYARATSNLLLPAGIVSYQYDNCIGEVMKHGLVVITCTYTPTCLCLL